MEKSRGQRIYKSIMLVIITMLITAILTTIFVYRYMIDVKGNIKYITLNSGTSGIEATLSQFRSLLEKEYIGEIDDTEMLESAIKGYIEGLGDPYTEYYTKDEMKEFMQQANGNYVGIGIYMMINKEENNILIIKPMEGSPAEEVGLQTGDIITKINGEEITSENIDGAADKIKGESGTKVKLEIIRNEEVKEFEVERRKILISHINSEKLENNIGYINIVDFDGGVADEFKTKYKELEEQGITSLIIDIRNNGGGVVDEAIEILECITEKNSTLLITVDKNENEEVTKSKKQPIINVPIVVITNGYSASASEILAGALKENNKATIVGTTTYGKGVIQTLHQLSDGSGIKITTNEYYTPNKNKINKIGITPDIECKLPEELQNQTEIAREDDVQLQKAIEVLTKDM